MDISRSAISGAAQHNRDLTNKIAEFTDKCESIVEEFVKAVEAKYINGTSSDLISEISDDESVATIGEISIDEIFDEICYGNTSQSTEKQSDKEPSSSKPFSSVINDNPDISLISLQKIVNELHPTILIERTSFADYLRTEVIRAADTSNTHNSGKRQRTNQGKGGYSKRLYNDLILDDIGVNTLPCFLYFHNTDEQIMATKRYVSILPASHSIFDILKEFVEKKKIDRESMFMMLEAFDSIFSPWGLHKIEKLQYETIIEKYPGRPLNEMYGLVHFVRFSTFIPYLLRSKGSSPNNYRTSMIDFMNRFINYMEEMQFVMRTDEYDHVMPDYYRMTFNHGPSKFIYNRN